MPSSSLPNVQPIYCRDVFSWDARLSNQVTGRKITTENPVLLGAFGSFGGLVWSIRAVPLGANVSTNLRLYTYKPTATTADEYRLLMEVPLPAILDTAAEFNAVIEGRGNHNVGALSPTEIQLPRIFTRNTDEARGLVGQAEYQLFCGLSREVVSGWDIFVEGGNY